MAEQTTATPAPLTNSAEARTETGELKDQSTVTTAQTENTTSTPTSETKPADQPDGSKPAAEGDKTDNKTPAVPDKYEFKAPEGLTFDPKAIEAATPIFKELGLTQDAAQKLVEFAAKREADLTKTNLDTAEKMRSDWRNEIKADKEIGGKLPEVQAIFSKAVDATLGPDLGKEFKAALDLTGAGDHPAIVKGLYKWAQSVTEGTHVSGNGPSKHGQSSNGRDQRPSPAAAMYPNLAS